MYNQLINYRDNLKMYSTAIDEQIHIRIEKDEAYKSMIELRKRALNEYENSFEKLRFKERDKIVKLRDSFNHDHNLFLHFDTSNYNNKVSDTIFNRLMEIDFYRIKISYKEIYLLRHGCI